MAALRVVVVLCCAAAVVSGGWPSRAVTFSGNVTVDFPEDDAGVFVVSSVGGNAVWAAEENSGVDEPSGWDIIDLRFSYDNATDTLYGGINTGACFTGDTDCDGTDGVSANASSAGIVDEPALQHGEYVVFVFDFGRNFSAGDDGATGSSLSANVSGGFNPQLHAVVGVPSNGDSTATFRVARHGDGLAAAGFGDAIADGVTAVLFNGPGGPNATLPHLEFHVVNFSRVMTRGLGLASPGDVDMKSAGNVSEPLVVGNFDRGSPCISVFAVVGSLQSGIGDFTNEASNCEVPSPSASPSASSSASQSLSPSPSQSSSAVPPSPSSTLTPAPSVVASPSPLIILGAPAPQPPCAADRVVVPNLKPYFRRKLPSMTQDYIEVRLCLGAGTTVGSIGIQYLHIELSQNGIDYFTLYELSYPTSVGDCIAGPYLPVNGPLPSWTYNSDAQACVPKTSNYAQCAAVYLVPPVEYMYVKGRAAGVQTGELCAFGPTERFQTTGVKQRIDYNFMDGLIISQLPSLLPNKYKLLTRSALIWAYAVGASDATAYFDGSVPDSRKRSQCGCPCTGTAHGSVNLASAAWQALLVPDNADGEALFHCSTAYHDASYLQASSGWLVDTLWDRAGSLSVADSGFEECANEDLEFVCRYSISASASPTPTPTPTPTPSPSPSRSTSPFPAPLDAAGGGGGGSSSGGGSGGGDSLRRSTAAASAVPGDAAVVEGAATDDDSEPTVTTSRVRSHSGSTVLSPGGLVGLSMAAIAVGVALVAVGAVLHKRRVARRNAVQVVGTPADVVSSRLTAATHASAARAATRGHVVFDSGFALRTDAFQGDTPVSVPVLEH